MLIKLQIVVLTDGGTRVGGLAIALTSIKQAATSKIATLILVRIAAIIVEQKKRAIVCTT